MTKLPDCFTCQHCGKEERVGRWSHGAELREKRLCFNCDFYLSWRDEAAGRSGDMFVAEGTLYAALEEPDGAHGRTLGCGGRSFRIDYLDGRPARITRNLWTQGAVPDEFKELFPDTAVLTEVFLQTTVKGSKA